MVNEKNNYVTIIGLFHITDYNDTGGLPLGFLSGFPRFPLGFQQLGHSYYNDCFKSEVLKWY